MGSNSVGDQVGSNSVGDHVGMLVSIDKYCNKEIEIRIKI